MNEKISNASSDKAIELFAKACERLNDFSRDLWESSLYVNALTSSNIRNYLQGWRLEKYVEANLQNSPEDSVSWCLELGKPDHWLIHADVSVAHGGVYMEVMDCLVETDAQLEIALNRAVDALIAEAKEDSAFHQKRFALSP
jgi:hypothetical protein